ncbi:MAG: hypothetical protein IKB70_03390 [Bacilli bacterium]|nr:hypothetical protein [Bacilli bacterium]
MALQTTVNKELAIGMVGEFSDDSPRRVMTYKGFTTRAVQATGTLTGTENFSANETVTVGVQTYTFKSTLSTPAVAYEVKVGADLATSLANLAKAINVSGTAGTDYGEGTLANALCTAKATSTTVVVTAKEFGTAGNSIATTETASNASWGGATLASGVDGVNAKIGVAYTSNGYEGEAVVGGSGVFLGIAVNPKEYIRYNNFEATMDVPGGTAVQLCTFGHIFVKVTANISVGQAGYFNTSTGEIKGATAGTDLSGSGFTEIKNSRFIEKSASAGQVAILELGN